MFSAILTILQKKSIMQGTDVFPGVLSQICKKNSRTHKIVVSNIQNYSAIYKIFYSTKLR